MPSAYAKLSHIFLFAYPKLSSYNYKPSINKSIIMIVFPPRRKPVINNCICCLYTDSLCWCLCIWGFHCCFLKFCEQVLVFLYFILQLSCWFDVCLAVFSLSHRHFDILHSIWLITLISARCFILFIPNCITNFFSIYPKLSHWFLVAFPKQSHQFLQHIPNCLTNDFA